MIQKKFLIIGAGIAGISLSKYLIDAGASVTLIDSGVNRSSVVAAGMINPIVFRRMTKSWRVDEFIPFAEDFYTNFGKACKQQFFFPITIRRMFSTEQERNFWLEKQELEAFSPYLIKVTKEDEHYSSAINIHGSGRVKNASYVSTVPFLEGVKKWLSERITILQETVDYSAIEPENSTYKNEKFDGIFFCEGVEVRHNPWFGSIPINPTKGETITIKSSEIPENESLNRKCFILPVGNSQFRVGATYAWDTYNDDLTEEGKNEMVENLSYLTNANYSIIGQTAGIRPTTLDRRPIMGRHEVYSNLFIFNGLGAKGYMLAPLLAKEMVEYVLEGKELDKEMRYSRLKK